MPPQDKKNMRLVIMQGASSIYETNHPLARLWRNLIVDTGVGVDLWNRLLTEWTNKHERGSDKDYTSQKGNLTKQLARRMISWKGWMTGLSILQYEKMELKIILHRKGKTTELDLMLDIETEVKNYGTEK